MDVEKFACEMTVQTVSIEVTSTKGNFDLSDLTDEFFPEMPARFLR
jgi:hypothetical protein